MFVISSQTAIAPQPAKGTFDDPTAWQALEAFHAGQASHDLDAPAELLSDIRDDVCIGGLSPHEFQPAPTIMDTALDLHEQLLHAQFARRAIRETGAMH